jgi:hypothetical protein
MPRVLLCLLVVVAALVSGCFLFQRVDDFGEPLMIENKTNLALLVVYSARGIEKYADELEPGETAEYVSQFSIERGECLEGNLIARAGEVEVARIHAPCRGTTWTIEPGG